TANWPETALDGELWLGYQRFAETSSIVRRQEPSDTDWRKMHYMVFDLPQHPGTFDERVPAIRQVVAAINKPWVRAIKQYKVADEQALQQHLKIVIAAGGE